MSNLQDNNVDCFALQVMVLEAFPSNVKMSMSGGSRKRKVFNCLRPVTFSSIPADSDGVG